MSAGHVADGVSRKERSKVSGRFRILKDNQRGHGGGTEYRENLPAKPAWAMTPGIRRSGSEPGRLPPRLGRSAMSGWFLCVAAFSRLLLVDGRSAVVLGRGAAELPLEAFGKIGRIIKPYLQGDFRDVPELSLNKFCGSV